MTHGLLGWAIAQAGPSQKYGRAATATLVVGSVFPDIDFVLGFHGTATYLEHHRGFTHCLLGWVPTALAVAAPVWWMAGKKNFRPLFLLSFAAVGLHIFCDALNAFGVMPFYPFSEARFQLDWVFVIDLFFAGLCLFGAILAWRLRSARPARWALGLLSAYIAFCAGCHFIALAHMKRKARWSTIQVAAIPGPGVPTRWMGVLQNRSGVQRVWFDVFGREESWLETEPAPKPEEVAALRATHDGRVFLWFARFPVREERDGRVVISDSRFRLPPGWSERRPFAIVLDPETGARFEK